MGGFRRKTPRAARALRTEPQDLPRLVHRRRRHRDQHAHGRADHARLPLLRGRAQARVPLARDDLRNRLHDHPDRVGRARSDPGLADRPLRPADHDAPRHRLHHHRPARVFAAQQPGHVHRLLLHRRNRRLRRRLHDRLGRRSHLVREAAFASPGLHVHRLRLRRIPGLARRVDDHRDRLALVGLALRHRPVHRWPDLGLPLRSPSRRSGTGQRRRTRSLQRSQFKGSHRTNAADRQRPPPS